MIEAKKARASLENLIYATCWLEDGKNGGESTSNPRFNFVWLPCVMLKNKAKFA
jgi:hypothetical protein